jgi:autotransporter-associated beta strand protein
LGGSGGLTKAGGGTLTLTGANTYNGSTAVNAGQLFLANPFAYASATTTLAAGAMLVISNAANGNLAANTAYAGAGVLQKTGAGMVGNGNQAVHFYLATNGVFDVQAGDFNLGGLQAELLNNAGSLNVAAGATFHISDPAWQADGLTGGGKINNAYDNTTPTLTLGVAGTANNATYGVTNNTAVFSGVIGYAETYNTVSVGTMNLIKTGAGTQVLAGASGYTGTTTISNGTLLVNGSLAAGSAVTVVAAGTLGGTGTVGGAVTVAGTLAPGPGVATLNTGAETWNGGGSYACNLSATNASGCDRLNLSGALTVVATSGSPFTVKLVSLNAGNTPGLLTNFNKFTNYAWTVATASGGVANFATNKFTLNTSAFANDFTGGSFAVVVAGNNLVVNYTAALLVSPRFTATAAGAAGMQLVATGGVGQAYVLLGATNLAPAVWTPLVTNAAGTNGAVLFADPQATNYSQRFYRLSLP